MKPNDVLNRFWKEKEVKTDEEKKAQLEKETQIANLLHTEDDINNSRCGIGLFKPNWLQHLALKEFYIIVYCMVGITQGMFFAYTTAVLSTLEKRFKLTSKKTGIFLSGNDVSAILLVIFLGYFGNYGHRTRWIGTGVILAAASGFIAALPHFIYGPGEVALQITSLTSHTSYNRDSLLNITEFSKKEKEPELCLSHPEDSCEEEDDGYVLPIICFFVAQFLVGISTSLYYSIGVTYLDDNCSKKTYPIYYAMSYMLRVLGPITGFFVGGKCLSVWIDPTQRPNISQKDPRWYGAWWIGYIFMGCTLLIAGNLFLLFPKKLPDTLKREVRRIFRQTEKDAIEGNNRRMEYFVNLAKTKREEKDQPNFRNLRKAFRRHYTNKIWSAIMFNTVLSVLAASGYWTFQPKYLQSQFRKSASESGYFTGLVALLSLIIGSGTGGAIMRWCHPGPKLVSGYNIFITLVTSMGYILMLFVQCPKVNIVGHVESSSIVPPCSMNCNCTESFSPMCAEDGTTLFYSPCFAGCRVANTTAKPIVFSECSCINNSSSPLNVTHLLPTNFGHQIAESTSLGRGTDGYCAEDCNTLIYYLSIQLIIRIIEATGRVGNTLIYIRCVSDEDKSLALALMALFLSLFGFLPAPIIMGAFVDSACLIWNTKCGTTGNCWLYDTDKFRLILHLVPFVLTMLSILGDIVVFYYSDQLDLYGKKENDIDYEKTQEIDEILPLNTHQEDVSGEKTDNSSHGNCSTEGHK